MMAVVLEQHAGWHLEREEYALARILCRKCIEYSPAPRPDAVDKLAGALLGLGQLDEASAACKVAIELNYRNKWAWSTLARIYASRGDNRKALKCLQSILIFDPQDADVAESEKALRLAIATNAPAR